MPAPITAKRVTVEEMTVTGRARVAAQMEVTGFIAAVSLSSRKAHAYAYETQEGAIVHVYGSEALVLRYAAARIAHERDLNRARAKALKSLQQGA